MKNSNSGLASYSNTMQLKPSEFISGMIINDLYVEGIDYLEVKCSGRQKRASKRFKMRDLEISTRAYKMTFLVTDEKLNYKVCVLNKCPASPVISPDSVHIKFDNEILYQSFFNLGYLKKFFNYMGLRFDYISRIDLYRDFQKFRSTMPENLISDFAGQEILCKSRAKFNMIGVNNEYGIEFEYLRNGKKTSGRQFYLYNKSRELSQVGNKEHIIETWKKANFEAGVDVWRLELSLSKGRRNMEVDTDTGEVSNIDLGYIFKKWFRYVVYESGLKSSFTFVEISNKRKSRCKKIKLFRGRGINNKLMFGVYNVDKLRMRKVILKSLMNDVLQDKEIREHKTVSVENKLKAVRGYVNDYSLFDYYQKLIEFFEKKYSVELSGSEGFAELVYKYYLK